MTKISDLSALTGAGVDDAADLLPIVDMSETGAARNKKITIDETRIALGLSSTDSPQFTAVNLGHASDTTITRVSAGVVAIEGVNIVTTAGGITFAADIVVPADPYDATNWNGNNEVPTKNDVRDKIESLSAGSGVTVEDEGVSEGTGITTLNFSGAGCSVTVVGAEAEIIVPGGGVSDLDDLSDVDTTGQAAGDVLTYDGAEWVPVGFSGALVTKAADQTAADYDPGTVIGWDSETYDVGGWHDNVTNNSRFTVPSGVSRVRITGQVWLSSVTAGNQCMLTVIKNGSAIDTDVGMPAQTAAPNNTERRINVASAVLAVSPGDYFEAHLTVNADSSITVEATSSWFAINAV